MKKDSFCFGGQTSTRRCKKIYKFPRKAPNPTPNSLECSFTARIIADHPPVDCNLHQSLCVPFHVPNIL